MSTVLNIVGTINDSNDTSKSFGVNLSGATSGTSLTLTSPQTSNIILTVPDISTTIVGTDIPQDITGLKNFTNMGYIVSEASILYNTGTVSQSTNVVTGVGTVFTLSMVGGIIVYNNGIAAMITGFTSATSITAEPAQAVSSQTFRIYYGAVQSMDGYLGTAGVNFGGLPASSVIFTDSFRNATTTGVVPPSNGGTGSSSTPSNGQILIGNGSGYTLSTITQGTGINITNGVGTITVTNAGVTSWAGGTTGLTPASATTGAVVLAGTLNAVNGGTGQTSYAIGDLLYANTTATLAKLADVAAGSYLRSGGVGTAPLWSTLTLPNAATTGDILYATASNTIGNLTDIVTGNALLSGGVGVVPLWGKIGLTTHVSGVLPIANGGTNASSALVNNRIMVSSGGSILETSALNNGQLLIGSTGAAPTAANITQGAGVTITNGAGSITIANAGVTSWSAGTTGLTPDSATTGAVVLAGTLIAVNGGTGQTSYVVGDLLYANTTTTLAKLADVATGNALISGGVGIAPLWGKIGLTTHVSGVLPVANGGTNSSTALNNNRIMVSNGGAIIEAAALTNGQLLIGSTGAAPVAANITQGAGVTITNGAGSITITNAGVTSWSAGTTGLTPAAATTGTVTLAGTLIAVNGGTGQSSYTVGDLLYADTTTTLAKLPDVATGNALISGGIGVAPSWGKINLSTTASGTLLAAQSPAYTGNVTSPAGSLVMTIANNAVTNAKIADMPANTIKGNNTGDTANPIDLTVTQTTAMLNVFTSGLKGLAPASGGGTTNFLRADGTWAPPASGGAPGGVNTNVQYNNGGVFGGDSAYNFISGANPRVEILGTVATNNFRVGGATSVGTSTVYIESNNTNNEAQRVYFNSGVPATSGWISYAYDTSVPYIKIIDADDDPPYITFEVLGSGSYALPQYCSVFGARGTYSNCTNGFAWYIGNNTSGFNLITANAPQMELDSQWLRPPVGTTAQRPMPTVGMMRYNTTESRPESYVANVWMPYTGIINKSTVTQTVAATGVTDLISYVLPGGCLGTNNMIRIRTEGIWNNASGANRTVTMAVSYGETIMWQDASATLPNATTCAWHVDLMLAPNNSTASQTVSGLIMIGASGAATTGTGNLGTDEIISATPFSGTAAVNSNNDQIITFSINISGINTTWTKHYHTIELI